MDASGLKQNRKINLKSLFRKWVFVAKTSHVQERTVDKHIFLKNSFDMR